MNHPVEIFDRALLNARRNRVAAAAGDHDFLLQEVARDFVDRLSLVRREFRCVLDLGCHHGVVGGAVASAQPGCTLMSMDASLGLLVQAQEPRVCGVPDALPFADESFDLIVSGMWLHMVDDLPRAFAHARRALKPDGLFMAALLGGRTLHELRTAFLMAEDELEGGASPRVAPFAELGDLSRLLAGAKFALPVADSYELVVTYPSARALVGELKAMGASNALTSRRRSPIRRETFKRALSLYDERFALSGSRVNATFEIMTVTGWAAHPNQPKPLRPGSATHRLADALQPKQAR